MFTDPAERALFEAVSRRARLVRFGGDCYAYAQLAMGHVDVVIDTGLQPYDIVAPMAVIEQPAVSCSAATVGSAAAGRLRRGDRFGRAGLVSREISGT